MTTMPPQIHTKAITLADTRVGDLVSIRLDAVLGGRRWHQVEGQIVQTPRPGGRANDACWAVVFNDARSGEDEARVALLEDAAKAVARQSQIIWRSDRWPIGRLESIRWEQPVWQQSALAGWEIVRTPLAMRDRSMTGGPR